MNRIARRLDAVLVQAVIAGALSFAHLHDIAEAAGQDGWKGWAYPVSVDLLLVAAWRRLRTRRGGVRLAWVWFLIALAVSLGANIATAGFLNLADPPAWLRMLVAGWPAAAFLGGTLLAHSTEPTPTPAPAPAPVPASPPVPAPVPAEELSVVHTIEREPGAELPSVPPQDPAPEPEPPAPAVETPEPVPALPEPPPALIVHARKVADAHRTSTGHEIDTDTLRARLGVPPAMAQAIAAQLA
ncbi:DUF2637 domain-containing protein [Streptomyces syringium]|uniref:DUF2637 domain-containing protein n=1 Tax=Streptomyces syringium TaxID=76729 RepID=UPI0036BAC064